MQWRKMPSDLYTYAPRKTYGIITQTTYKARVLPYIH